MDNNITDEQAEDINIRFESYIAGIIEEKVNEYKKICVQNDSNIANLE